MGGDAPAGQGELRAVFQTVAEELRHAENMMLTTGLAYLTAVAIGAGQLVQTEGGPVAGIRQGEMPLVILAGFGFVALLYQYNTLRWKGHYLGVARRIGDHWRSQGLLPDDPMLVMVWMRPKASETQRRQHEVNQSWPTFRFLGLSSVWLTLTQAVEAVILSLAVLAYWDQMPQWLWVPSLLVALGSFLALVHLMRRDLTRQSLDEPFSL